MNKIFLDLLSKLKLNTEPKTKRIDYPYIKTSKAKKQNLAYHEIKRGIRK